MRGGRAGVPFEVAKALRDLAAARGDAVLADEARTIFLDAIGDVSGLRVLDVGTGSGGSVAIPAARRGARATGLDVTDAWFEDGRRRAEQAGVEGDWVAGDAMDMPLPDGSFDRVLSNFGHMFAPDHGRTAAEMARVCAPDGVLDLRDLAGTAYPGGLFRTIGRHMPPPPAGVQPPRWRRTCSRCAMPRRLPTASAGTT